MYLVHFNLIGADMPLFKYIQEQYLKMMLDKGTIKIGTFADFQRFEHDQIGDPNEGKRAVVMGSQPFINSGSEDLADFFRALGADISPGGISASPRSFYAGAHSARSEFRSPNCLVYCTTTTPSLAASQSFGCGNDCIEIVNPMGFWEALTIGLDIHLRGHLSLARLTSASRGFLPCVYGPREHVWNEPTFDPYVRKEPKFTAQHEARCIWHVNYPNQLNPTYVFDAPAIRPFIRRRTLI